MFSVIVPVFNKVSTLERCVNSVLRQDFDDFELILVCDPSDDGSTELAHSFGDRRVKVISRMTPGPGGYAARNAGLDTVKHQWISFLDADDELMPNFLSTVASNVKSGDCADAYCTGWLDSFSDSISRNCLFLQKHSFAHDLTFDYFLDEAVRFRPALHTNVVVIRSEIAQNFRFPEECTRGGDTVFWLKLFTHVDIIRFIPIVGAVYHREDSSVTRFTRAQTKNNCVVKYVDSLVSTNFDRARKVRLKRFGNFHLEFGFRAAWKLGALSLSDLRHYYRSVNFFKFFIYFFIALLPGIVQVKIYQLLKVLSK